MTSPKSLCQEEVELGFEPQSYSEAGLSSVYCTASQNSRYHFLDFQSKFFIVSEMRIIILNIKTHRDSATDVSSWSPQFPTPGL